MGNILVDSQKCPQDHACPMVRMCPAGAISQRGFNAPKIDENKCIKCGTCINACPYSVFGFP